VRQTTAFPVQEQRTSGLSNRPAAGRDTDATTRSGPPKAIASLTIDGKRREVPVADNESILDAALRAGMDLPFAC